ncbi:MAG: 30S ribosomal protein S6 [Patescibacteria group bacterium]
MRSYELVLILKKSLSETQQKKIVEAIKGLLKGANFLKESELGQKTLSYPIKRETVGIYFDWVFDMQLIPSELEKKLLEDEGILRHLLIRRK